MAKNKNAMLRYQVLDRCFRNPGKMYFIPDLIDECNRALQQLDFQTDGIRERQLYEDIRFMESEAGFSAPIVRYRHGRSKYYRYDDLSYSINNQPLNQSEVQRLKDALQLLIRISAQPHYQWVSEIILKLETKLGMIEQERPVISFSWNEYLKGVEYLGPLFSAALEQHSLEVTYQDFRSESPLRFIFHPAYLKQYNNRWFVIGFHEPTQNDHWILALDRIIKLDQSTAPYRVSDIDWEEYFDDMIGVTRLEGVRAEEIVLQVKLETAPYVMTKPFHSSQRSKFFPTYLEVRFRVIPNFELESQILSFGELVKVVSPDSLRLKIQERLQSALG